MSFETLDPGSRELLDLAYRHRLSDDEVVGVIGLSSEAVGRWRRSALRRLALRTHMSTREVENVLLAAAPDPSSRGARI
jgi:DNA-directed RNA polymerase specialized sigma24 family protein